ncbi:ribonuclease Y-like [Palaemon carinicauda]|uniref:ribonuclease Y-like n=1 Tax=Palaemon carinicauda TaxID=392227 RepID=UPI0035B5FEE4
MLINSGKLPEEDIAAAYDLLEKAEAEFIEKHASADPKTEGMKAETIAEAEIRRIAAEENLIKFRMMAEREVREEREGERAREIVNHKREEARHAWDMEEKAKEYAKGIERRKEKGREEAREIARNARALELLNARAMLSTQTGVTSAVHDPVFEV